MENIEKKAFVNYTLPEDKKKTNLVPLTIKVNKKDLEMIEIGRYAFNSESKGGVIKLLADMGLKVILQQIGVENMHKLTNPRRVKYEQEKPKYIHYNENLDKR